MVTERENAGDDEVNITCTGVTDKTEYRCVFTKTRTGTILTYYGENGERQRPSENREKIASIAKAHGVKW